MERRGGMTVDRHRGLEAVAAVKGSAVLAHPGSLRNAEELDDPVPGKRGGAVLLAQQVRANLAVHTLG